MNVGFLPEAAALAIAAVLAGRILMRPAVRRELRAHPYVGLFGLVALPLVLAALLWLLTQGTAIRRAAVGAVVVLGALAWYRARPGYGTRRGWPPGSLGLGESLRAVDDGHFYAAGFQRWGSVFKMSQVHRPVACVEDLALAGALLRQDGGAIRQVDWPFNRLLPGNYVEFMDGAAHAHYRALLVPGFAPQVLHAAADDLAEVCRATVAALAQSCEPDGVAPHLGTAALARRALLRIVAGADPDQAEAANVSEWLTQLAKPVHPWQPIPAATRRALAELIAWLRRLGSEYATAPPARPPRCVLTELVRKDPALLRDEVLFGNLATMLHDGSNMLGMLLAWLVQRAATQPAALRQLGASGEQEAAAFARAFVLEVLRLDMTPYIYRKVVDECRLGPYRIPRGWLLRICLREAHRSPRVFEQPLDFAPARFLERSYGVDEFWPFSIGVHACFAEPFVRLVAEEFLRQLAAFDLQLLDDGPAERGNRHWSYAVPSRRLRVRLTPAAAVRAFVGMNPLAQASA